MGQAESKTQKKRHSLSCGQGDIDAQLTVSNGPNQRALTEQDDGSRDEFDGSSFGSKSRTHSTGNSAGLYQNENNLLATIRGALGNSSTKNGSVEEYFSLHNELGRGTFAVVRRATFKKTKQQVALKCMRVNSNIQPLGCHGGQTRSWDIINREKDMLKLCEHENVVKFHGIFSDGPQQNAAYLAMEWLQGGDLTELLTIRIFLSEEEVFWIISQLMKAIAHLHSVRVIHRDIKLDNIMLGTTTHPLGVLNASLKLGDFGIAVELNEAINECDAVLEGGCGTLGYAAPEVIVKKKRYGCRADVWSAGVVMYTLFCGDFPFAPQEDDSNLNIANLKQKGPTQNDGHKNDTKKTLALRQKKLILAAKPNTDSRVIPWSIISAESRLCMLRMLTKNQDDRLSAIGFARDPWARACKQGASIGPQ